LGGHKVLPLASGDRHVRTLKRLGWDCTRMHGSHAVMEKPGHPATLTIPCHKGRDVKRALLAAQLKVAGIPFEDYRKKFR
jgi:predicted RNA binding protein YcfA (HicA-like mRNA interferase family)